jgi:O-antigen ligase
MPPQVMTLVCIIGIVGLFALERDKEARTSKALWIPVAWLFINCSRSVSLWLATFGIRAFGTNADPGQVYLEGSPVDGAAFTLLLIAGLIVLAHRIPQVSPFFRKMLPILLFFTFCAVSTLWSDYPFVTFKHWNKGIGDIVMVLVVLTDPEPAAALKRLLSRVSFVLLPLSILFIKYYPSVGRAFTNSGSPMYTGVTMQKNGLGAICLVFGLGSFWRILASYRNREVAHRTRLLIVHGTILAMVLWLLRMCNSMTSISCFTMGAVLMLLASRTMVARRPAMVHLLVATMIGLSMFGLFFDSSGGLVQDLGRDPTLTGRTAVWDAALSLAGNPLIGTGYESFWLGKRLEQFWRINDGAFVGINEAHNGYLELFLNLGWVGMALLAVLIVTGYPKVIATWRRDPATGSLGLAFFVSEMVYNLTEAGFRMMFPLWIFFLLAVLGVPRTPLPQSLPAMGDDLPDELTSMQPHVGGAVGVGYR